MTRRALRDVLLSFTASFVHKLHRDSRDLIGRCVRSGQLMTTVAVVGDRLLRLPMAVETRSVIGRRSFERRRSRSMTDRAVVVILRWMCEPQERDRILVLVVWKLDRELKLR